VPEFESGTPQPFGHAVDLAFAASCKTQRMDSTSYRALAEAARDRHDELAKLADRYLSFPSTRRL
jgi:hypothetical protein